MGKVRRKKKDCTKKKSRSKPRDSGKKSSKKVVKLKTRNKRGCEKQYSVNDIQEALNAIGKGQTLREAEQNFGVPRSTLHAKLNNVTAVNCRKGPPTVLTAEEEEDVVKWILYRASRGFPVTRDHLLNCVQTYLNDEEKKKKQKRKNNPFKNNRPSKHWFNAFMHRHQNLSQRVAQKLTSTRASVTEAELRQWFTTVKNYLNEKNLLSIDPQRIFNLDESAFMLVPDEENVITEKGARAPYRIVGGNDKACLTVLFVVSASGCMAPPMILYDLKTTPKKKVLENIPEGWGVGNSERGWMTGETFYYFIVNVFYNWLQQNEIQFPIILYVDGHSSHLTLPLVEFCTQNEIELIALYPNATHILQPLDVAVFRPLKDTYKTVLRQWRIDNNVIDFQKYMFPPVLDLALKEKDLTNTIINGFRSCGLYPFNPDAVEYNILNKQKKKKSVPSSVISSCSQNGSIEDNSYTQLLSLFEKSIIEPGLLEAFKRDELQGLWSGDVKYLGVFESWRKIKSFCNNTIEKFTPQLDVPDNHTNESSMDVTYVTDTYSDQHSIDISKNVPDSYSDDRLIDINSVPDCSINDRSSDIDLSSVPKNNTPFMHCEETAATYLPITRVREAEEVKTDPLLDMSSIEFVDEQSLDNMNGSNLVEESIITIPNDTQAEFNSSLGEIEFLDESGQRRTASIIAVIPDTVDNKTCDSTFPIPENNILRESAGNNGVKSSINQCLTLGQSNAQEESIYSVQNNSSDDCGISYESKSNESKDLPNTNSNAVFNSKDSSKIESDAFLNDFEDTILDLSIGSSCKTPVFHDSNMEQGSVLKTLNRDDQKDILFKGDNAVDMQHSFKNEHSKSTSSKDATELDISVEMKSAFPVPTFKSKKRKKTNTDDIPPAATRDHLHACILKKEEKKKLKEQQILSNKQKREKIKIKKERELDIKKAFREHKKKLLEEKKNINVEIKNINKNMKSESSKENAVQLEEKKQRLETRLEEVERLLLEHEMQAVQQRLKVKQEKE